MKVSQHAKRIVALAVCLVMMAALAVPAMAEMTLFPRAITTATPVYSSNDTTSSQLGSFNAGDIVGVTAQDSAHVFWQIYDQNAKVYGWIPQSAVSNTATSNAITPMRAINTSLAAVAPIAGATASASVTGGAITTGTTTSTGTAGYVTNCSSWVYYRSSASTASSARAGKISKNAVVSILGTSGSFTKCLYNGQTVYIDSRYVTSGTPSSSSGSTSTANGSATITNCSSWVSMRKSASSKSTRLYKLNKGTAVTVLGTSGEYTKISYKSKTGYVLSTYVGGSTGGSTTANTGASSKAGTGGVRIARNSSVTRNAVLNTMNQFKAKNSDVVGMMNILDGQITEPILYDASGSFFYNDHDVNKASNSTGAIYSLYNGLPRNNVISGHNMRQSGTMFHRLHHLQERALGYNMCQAVNAGTNHSIGDVPDLNSAANRIWEISFAGYTQWQVWAFYEVDANEPASTITFNCQHLSSSTPSQVVTWVETQKTRASTNAKGKYFETDLSSDDIYMTLITCGDGYDSATAQSRLYFFLRAYK